jgi:transcriptional regulator with XRE-family HTH domain
MTLRIIGISGITKIRLRMLEDGRPQYQIAADVGIPPARLSEYALGRRPIPAHRIFDLVRVFNCNPEDILGYENDDAADITEGRVADLPDEQPSSRPPYLQY